ncbi:hypothetical protein [Rhizobium sp. BG4]|uniref:hypothetical protein n=1 Tax=Rhizobium sp. BG4 TaxID=2613770 RepID=UPI00193D5920|nr:hypothetical protein [Rhizobium sp. BG4]
MSDDALIFILTLTAVWCVIVLVLVGLCLRRAALRMRRERLAYQRIYQPFVMRKGE